MTGRRSENFVNGVDYSWHLGQELTKAVKQFHDRYKNSGIYTAYAGEGPVDHPLGLIFEREKQKTLYPSALLNHVNHLCISLLPFLSVNSCVCHHILVKM